MVLEDVEKPFNELACLHTYDLLVLLLLVRKERAKAYDLKLTLKKAAKSPQIDEVILKLLRRSNGLYTKRMRVIEGILIDRMRYKPQRVDDKLLAKLAKKLRKEYKKARPKDIQNGKILSYEEMEFANELQANTKGMKLVPDRKIKNNIPFVQIIQHNFSYLRKEGYLTLAEEGFLVGISEFLGFSSNCIEEKRPNSFKSI